MQRSIWIVHQPRQFGHGHLRNGQRVGSPTVLQFAADDQPLLGCSGHIHESPTKRWEMDWTDRQDCLAATRQIDFKLHYVTLKFAGDSSIASVRHSILAMHLVKHWQENSRRRARFGF